MAFAQAGLITLIFCVIPHRAPQRSVLIGPDLDLFAGLAALTIAAISLGLLISTVFTKLEHAVALVTATSIAQIALNGVTSDLSTPSLTSWPAVILPDRWGVAAAASSVNMSGIERGNRALAGHEVALDPLALAVGDGSRSSRGPQRRILCPCRLAAEVSVEAEAPAEATADTSIQAETRLHNLANQQAETRPDWCQLAAVLNRGHCPDISVAADPAPRCRQESCMFSSAALSASPVLLAAGLQVIEAIVHRCIVPLKLLLTLKFRQIGSDVPVTAHSGLITPKRNPR